MRSAKHIFALVLTMAFAVAWLAPRTARAAILPACELREQLTLAPAAEPAPFARDALATIEAAAEACAAPSDDTAGGPAPCDEIADVPGMAPMSDARGATMIAPPRIRPVEGGTIKGISQCSQLDLTVTAAEQARNGFKELGAGPGLVAVLHDTAPTLGPAPAPALVPVYPPPDGGPLAGVRRGIEHPPR